MTVAVMALGASMALAVPVTQTVKPLEQRGTLRVLVSSDENPEMYDYKGTAANPGLEREILEGFARLHNLKVESVPMDFEGILTAIQKGEADIATGIIDTPFRRQQVAFTTEVLPARHLVVTRKPAPAIDTLDQLRAQRVSVIKGSSWEEQAKAAGVPAAKIDGYGDQNAAQEALKSGKNGAMVMAISDYTLAHRRDPALTAGMFLGQPGSAGWAVRQEDTVLRAALDEYLTSIRKTPSWGRLVVKYFGEDALSVLGRAKKE
jgi:ABC-type amino acid transport substrate-binding protein